MICFGVNENTGYKSPSFCKLPERHHLLFYDVIWLSYSCTTNLLSFSDHGGKLVTSYAVHGTLFFHTLKYFFFLIYFNKFSVSTEF